MSTYSVYSTNKNDQLKEPMFLGQSVNVARYDQQKYIIFEKLIEKQLSFFWRPEEIAITKDRIDYMNLPDHEKHIFLSNLKYQTLLDSIQGRAPNVAFLPITSIPELETWVETWSFSETIHSRSYTHIIRGIVTDPGVVFDDIVTNEEILKRAIDISKYYDNLIEYTQYWTLFSENKDFNFEGVVKDSAGESRDYVGSFNKKELMKRIYLCLMTVNVLEAIRFYVSFACSFAFGEQKKMEGNAKIIKLIARDENLHLVSTQHMIKLLKSGAEGEEWAKVAAEAEEECYEIFRTACQQEKDWASYLFKDGSMIGLNANILCQYMEYITDQRLAALGMKPIFGGNVQNPIPWTKNWLSTDTLQVANQETENTGYLTNQLDSEVDMSKLQMGIDFD